jgi:hypothetical protein
VQAVDFSSLSTTSRSSSSSPRFVSLPKTAAISNLQIQQQGDTAIHASVRLLPFVMILIFVIILNGAVMTKLGYYYPWYFLGGAFELAAGVLMCTSTKIISPIVEVQNSDQTSIFRHRHSAHIHRGNLRLHCSNGYWRRCIQPSRLQCRPGQSETR